MHQLHVVGIGLDGWDGLSQSVRQLLSRIPTIAGPASHLNRIAVLQQLTNEPFRQLQLPSTLRDWPQLLRQELRQSDVALLATGDPLFFGIGRLLTQQFAPEQLVFHPHLSCVQLACSRLQLPWQSATIISIHGRSLDPPIAALKQGKSPIAILTDPKNSPASIAALLTQLQLPTPYRLSVCCQLGSKEESIQTFSPDQLPELSDRKFPSPNVVVLQRTDPAEFDPKLLPQVGIRDSYFLTFSDRPGLITKQEIRTLSLSLLQLPTHGVFWDVGAGTGSIAVEIARLVPQGQVFAIEKDAAGIELITANAQRFLTPNLQAIAGMAPEALTSLPSPDRIFIGGGGPCLLKILKACTSRLNPNGLIVGNFATIERCNAAQSYLKSVNFDVQMLQINLSRSVAIAQSTRFSPLNPVTLLQAIPPTKVEESRDT